MPEQTLARDVKAGDRIELDMGYGPMECPAFCKVLVPGRVFSQLFPDPATADWLSFYVDDGVERFYTIPFAPDHAFNCRPK